MYIDPVTLNWIIIGAASFAAMMIGFHVGRKRDEQVISQTITYLANEGFVRSYVDENGELELVKLRDGELYGKRSTQDDDEDA